MKLPSSLGSLSTFKEYGACTATINSTRKLGSIIFLQSRIQKSWKKLLRFRRTLNLKSTLRKIHRKRKLQLQTENPQGKNRLHPNVQMGGRPEIRGTERRNSNNDFYKQPILPRPELDSGKRNVCHSTCAAKLFDDWRECPCDV